MCEDAASGGEGEEQRRGGVGEEQRREREGEEARVGSIRGAMLLQCTQS